MKTWSLDWQGAQGQLWGRGGALGGGAELGSRGRGPLWLERVVRAKNYLQVGDVSTANV